MLLPQTIILKPSVDENDDVTLPSFDVSQFVIGHIYLFHVISEGARKDPKPKNETTHDDGKSQTHG